MKKHTKEELLKDLEERLYWLSDNYPDFESLKEVNAFFVKWEKTQKQLLSSILVYLQWHPGRYVFLNWLENLDINSTVKEVFYNYWSPRICRSCNGVNIYVDGRGNYICRTCHPTGK